jgi:hypothetical protein
MIDTDVVVLIDGLKKLLKIKGYTYKKLANEIDLSEISVKRIFSNYDCSISRLATICRVIDSSVLELSEFSMKNIYDQNYYLTDEQETHFSKHPYHFFVFKELKNGKELNNIKFEDDLSKSELEKILLKLDMLKLIVLHPDNKVQVLVRGLIRPNLEGKFFNKVLKNQNLNFLETIYKNIKQSDCCFQSSEVQLSKKSLLEMVNDINEVGRKYREKAFIESKTISNEDLVSVRWLFALLPYKTNWK